jgi:hypothetical protein
VTSKSASKLHSSSEELVVSSLGLPDGSQHSTCHSAPGPRVCLLSDQQYGYVETEIGPSSQSLPPDTYVRGPGMSQVASPITISYPHEKSMV